MPRSMAAPIAGTWLVVSTAVMRAMSATFLDRTVSLDRPATGDHHGGVGLRGHPGHRAGGLQEALAIAGEDLGQEVDVAALGDARVVVAGKHRLLLRLGHRPLVEAGTFVGMEVGPALLGHQAHTELVEVV